MSQGMVYNIQRMSTKDGPGIRTTVFLKGCPLRCIWCSNPESQISSSQVLFFANLCTGCGACQMICPTGAAVMRGAVSTLDRAKCGNCGKCAEVCPTKAREVSGRLMTVDDVMGIVLKDRLYYLTQRAESLSEAVSRQQPAVFCWICCRHRPMRACIRLWIHAGTVRKIVLKK